MGYIFTFKRLVAPVLIQIIYLIGMALIIVGGILQIAGEGRLATAYPNGATAMMDQYPAMMSNPIVIAISIPIALIVWRVWCELWIVIFQIDDRLREIRDSLQGR